MWTRRKVLGWLVALPVYGVAGRLSPVEAAAHPPLPDAVAGLLQASPPSIVRPMLAERCLSPVWYWNGRGARYQRFQHLVVWQSDAVQVEFRVQNLGRRGGGRIVPFAGQHYPVTLDGEVIAEFSGAEEIASVRIDTRPMSDGWHVLDVVTPGEEMSVPFPVFVLRGEQVPPQHWMPVLTLSYHANRQKFCRLMWVPARYALTPVPIGRRRYKPFSDLPADDGLWFERLLPTSGYNRRPNVDQRGILNTFNTMWYNWSGMVRALPENPLLDGPRGVGTIGSAMHVDIGVATQTADPHSAPRDNLYVLDPWRVCRVDPSGHVHTLAGWRHRTPPSYWEDEPVLELVGDWSAIAPERRGFRELWGMAWDERTLEVDTAAEAIPEEQDRQPHRVGPVMFVADSQRNRICRLAFSPRSSAQPPVVTEFLTDLEDPWDVVYWQGSLIVSERQRHRIVQFDVKTGDFQRLIVQGEPLAKVSRNRRVRRRASLEQVRAQDCVAPEGLYVMDDWLYFGSIAMNQVRRVHLIDGTLEVVWNNAAARKDTFIKLAVSDGTFGPRHTVFITDWSVRRRGLPDARLPDGRSWNLAGNPRDSMPRGRGVAVGAIGYSGAVGVRNGRLVCGSIQEGLVEISLAGQDDPHFDHALYQAGQSRWRDEDLSLLYGSGGYGYYGLPLPWGHSPETDYYLEVNGHPRPGAG